MRKIILFILISISVFSEYKIENGKVYYEDKLIAEADAVTFDSSTDYAQDKNYIYAIRIDGVFTGKTRSIPAKKQPYPSLAEAAKTQSVFALQNTQGTIVGFWCPDYIKGINVTGYHLHFISADRKSGGHILSGEIKAGKVQVARVREFKMLLPNSAAFQNAALNKDYSKELNAVEKSK